MLRQARADGFSHARVDGVMVDLVASEEPLEGEDGEHPIELVVADLAAAEESYTGHFLRKVLAN